MVLNVVRATSTERNHFNTRGDSSLDEKAVYSFVLGHGYKCDLTGWTHTSCLAWKLRFNAYCCAQNSFQETTEPELTPPHVQIVLYQESMQMASCATRRGKAKQ